MFILSSLRSAHFAHKRNFFRVCGQMYMIIGQMAKSFGAEITLEVYSIESSHADE